MLPNIDQRSFDHWLQSCLRALVTPSLAVDGAVGPKTREALRQFQERAHELHPETGEIIPDGQIDPRTIRALELCTGTSYAHASAPATTDDALGSGSASALQEPSGVEPNHDVRHLTPEANRRPARPWTQIKGVTLHQTGMHRFSARAWPKVRAHLGIHHDGSVFWIHPLESRLPASNGFNRDTVAIEVAGNFLRREADVRSYWKKGGGPSTLTPEMVEGLRRAIRFIISEVERHGGRITHIHAHRQTNRNKASCPGEAIWRSGGVWAQRELGLSDGSPGYVRSDGLPIPPYWDDERPVTRSGSILEEPDVDDFEPELDAEYPDEDEEALPPPSARPRGFRILGIPAGLCEVTLPTMRSAARAERFASDPDAPSIPLADAGLELVGQLELEASNAAIPPGQARSRALEIEVSLGTDEAALVLLEHDGAFSWIHPRVSEAAAGPTPRGAPQPLLLRISANELTRPSGRSSIRGSSGTGWLSGRLRAFVYAVAKLALNEVIEHIDTHVSEGLVRVQGVALSEWVECDEPESTVAHLDRAPRILVLLHGAFGSTRASFGAFAGVGKILRRMQASYDLILGFDHRTLSRSPVDNARALAAVLLERAWPVPPRIDIIAHSRGALVARSLVEHLLPRTPMRDAVQALVLVGPMNGGTELARPENWHRFVDLVTTLTVRGVRTLSLVSGIGLGASLIGGPVLRGVGSLAKAMASAALTLECLPGLAAMVPGSSMVSSLNDDGGDADASRARYFLVSSSFDPSGESEKSSRRLSSKALAWIASEITTELFGGAESDLVVGDRSSRALHKRIEVEDVLHFAHSADVHHLNFFEQAELHDKLATWLELRAVPNDASTP